MRRSAKILILIWEGIIKKISCERRDYESVRRKKPILSFFLKNSGSKGLKLFPQKYYKKMIKQTIGIYFCVNFFLKCVRLIV